MDGRKLITHNNYLFLISRIFNQVWTFQRSNLWLLNALLYRLGCYNSVCCNGSIASKWYHALNLLLYVLTQVGSSNVIEAKADVVPSLDPSKRSTVDVVLGAQWGDEGKGKLVDILSSNYDICARVAGGSNAGHTIVVDVSGSVTFHIIL